MMSYSVASSKNDAEYRVSEAQHLHIPYAGVDAFKKSLHPNSKSPASMRKIRTADY
jgi:hypothetical protein